MDSSAWCPDLPLGGYYVTVRRQRPVASASQRHVLRGPVIHRAISIEPTVSLEDSEESSESESEQSSSGM